MRVVPWLCAALLALSGCASPIEVLGKSIAQAIPASYEDDDLAVSFPAGWTVLERPAQNLREVRFRADNEAEGLNVAMLVVEGGSTRLTGEQAGMALGKSIEAFIGGTGATTSQIEPGLLDVTLNGAFGHARDFSYTTPDVSWNGRYVMIQDPPTIYQVVLLAQEVAGLDVALAAVGHKFTIKH